MTMEKNEALNKRPNKLGDQIPVPGNPFPPADGPGGPGAQ